MDDVAIIYSMLRLSLICTASAMVSSVLPAQKVAPFGTCVPRSQQRAGAIGCFIIVDKPVGTLGTAPVYWHITRFPTRVAALRARPAHAAVVEAFHHVWLMDIASKASRSASGKEIATIGPLPITPGTSYSALYMEASMTPGMKSMIHRHSGPEIWYTLSGQTCLETPNGVSVGRAGGAPVIVPGNLPMQLTATGKDVRRSLVLILHDASKPPTAMEKQWVPRGECR